MYESTIALTLGLLVATALMPAAMAQGGPPAITEQEAQAIGVDAYLYFYPLISMDITRKQSTNIEPGKEFAKGPMNMFVNVPAFPPADLKVVVRVNSIRSIPLRGSTSPRNRRSSPRQTPADATISCRCSTCGRMFLHPPDGARPVRRRAIF
jgi:hypothetical protein